VAVWQYALTQLVAISTYLRLSFVPYPLVFDYGKGLVDDPAQIVPAAIVVVTLAIGTLAALWRHSWVGFLGAWWLLILSPSSSIVPILTQPIAEHRVYLPLAGLVVLVVMSIDFVWRRLTQHSSPEHGTFVRCAPAVTLALVATTLGTQTWLRNLDYRTPLSLWQDTVLKRPENARARSLLSTYLAEAGDLAGSLREATQCIALEPLNPQHYYDRGTVLLDLDRLTEALADFDRAIALMPTAQAYHNRGVVLCRLEQFESALVAFDQALRLDSAFQIAYLNRALAHYALKHNDLARRDFQQYRARGGSLDAELLRIEAMLNP
jgi:tetratricopeptide (TPR) repeat protein